jgi:hypothetical protein
MPGSTMLHYCLTRLSGNGRRFVTLGTIAAGIQRQHKDGEVGTLISSCMLGRSSSAASTRLHQPDDLFLNVSLASHAMTRRGRTCCVLHTRECKQIQGATDSPCSSLVYAVMNPQTSNGRVHRRVRCVGGKGQRTSRNTFSVAGLQEHSCFTAD